MEPLKPSLKQEILQASPTATPAEIAEYEKLLAERFAVDPDLPQDPAAVNLRQDKIDRLKQLRHKLFPDADAETTGEQPAMEDESTTLYEVPKEWSAENIEEVVGKLLRESEVDVVQILTSHKVPKNKAQYVATEAIQQQPRVYYRGSGSTGQVIAVAVSLTPLIKVLTPLLKPFSDRAARLGYEIGSDIWKMLRDKLLHKKNIRLYDKRSATRKGK